MGFECSQTVLERIWNIYLFGLIDRQTSTISETICFQLGKIELGTIESFVLFFLSFSEIVEFFIRLELSMLSIFTDWSTGKSFSHVGDWRKIKDERGRERENIERKRARGGGKFFSFSSFLILFIYLSTTVTDTSASFRRTFILGMNEFSQERTCGHFAMSYDATN